MKKLILPLILLSFVAHAQEMSGGLSDKAIKNKFLSTVKDVEVEKKLGASVEFNDCRKNAKFLPTDSKDAKDKKLADASACFQKLLKGKPESEIKKLSESLGLQSYELVKSNNVNDITEYLQNKMIKSLTGRDPSEKDPKKVLEQMKWKNQKIVDQKVFVNLYTNQLMKNALFEVSRYCFENLRIEKSGADKFSEHWSKENIKLKSAQDGTPFISEITDTGNPPFFSINGVDISDKEAVTGAIVTSLSDGDTIDPELYKIYFEYCSAALPKLCEYYKNDSLKKASQDSTSTDKDNTSLSKGSQSCLVMDRLRNLRKAMDDTAKVAKQFEQMESVDGQLAVQMLENPSIYGSSKSDESLDELTSISSTDMLTGSEKNKALVKLKEDCEFGKGGSDCDNYIVESDGLEKSLNNIEVEMTLKREAEVERVKNLKEKDLKTYLTENGMYDLLNRLESNDKSLVIEDEIRKIYDARKIALVEGLKNKIGKRQLTESEIDEKTKNKTIGSVQADNIKNSSEEKARMAQVVMFNNIITSQLELKDKSGKTLGRNVTAWNKEIKGISKDGGMDENAKVFKGLKESAKGSKAIDNASLGDGGIIDTILGKKSK